MKQHTIKRLFGRGVLCAALLAAAACTGNFEEYNTKPYRPTDDDLIGDNVGIGILFPSMMEWMTHYQVNASQYQDVLIGDELGGYCSAVKPYQGQNISTYNPSDAFNDPLFENSFSNFYGNYFQVLSSTDGEGAVFQLAQIIRVASMLRVTDAYGPIPYTQMQNGTFSVPYDSQRDVYLKMIEELDAAMAELYTFVSSGSTTLLADFDISNYAGDVRSWIRFANTLKLRMAIRMSGVESSARTIAEEAVAARETYGLIESTSESMYFVSTSRRNPFYTQAVSSSWQDLRSNANITMYMNAYADPRRSSYFSVSGYADQPYVGARSGIQNVVVTDYTSFSYPLYGETDPVPVMYAAESWFLRAEGALLGWSMGDTAENLYYKGIQTSLEEAGCSSSYSTYILTGAVSLSYTDPLGKNSSANFGAAPSVTWANDGQELERIIIQKWIANHMIGHEAWADFRRTGYPVMLMAVNNLSNGGMWGTVDGDRGMRRLHYPQSEYDNNNENLRGGVQLLGGPDEYGTDVWWAKKN